MAESKLSRTSSLDMLTQSSMNGHHGDASCQAKRRTLKQHGPKTDACDPIATKHFPYDAKLGRPQPYSAIKSSPWTGISLEIKPAKDSSPLDDPPSSLVCSCPPYSNNPAWSTSQIPLDEPLHALLSPKLALSNQYSVYTELNLPMPENQPGVELPKSEDESKSEQDLDDFDITGSLPVIRPELNGKCLASSKSSILSLHTPRISVSPNSASLLSDAGTENTFTLPATVCIPLKEKKPNFYRNSFDGSSSCHSRKSLKSLNPAYFLNDHSARRKWLSPKEVASPAATFAGVKAVQPQSEDNHEQSESSWRTKLLSGSVESLIRDFDAASHSSKSGKPSAWFLKLLGEKYHPFVRSHVPYSMSYDPQVMDYHILMLYVSSILQGFPSPFELETRSESLSSGDALASSNPLPSQPLAVRPVQRPTQKILDVGCGPYATWCVGLLRSQTNVDVVGLDLCPLLINLNEMEQSFSNYFHFVQYDFLSGNLPFLDATFHYVRAAFVAPGIPENKWTFLLEEFNRILKPNGTLELLESNLFVVEPQPLNDLVVNKAETKSNNSADDMVPTSVKDMFEQLNHQQFISSFPLSVIPSRLSSISSDFERPLFNKLRLSNELSHGDGHPSENPLKNINNSTISSHLPNLEKPPTILNDQNDHLKRVLLQAHADSLLANKEIIWEHLWSFDNQKKTLSRADSAVYSHANFAESLRAISGRTKATISLHSNHSLLKLSSLNHSERPASAPASEHEKLLSARRKMPRGKLQARRKEFEQIWLNWKESLNLNASGISQLLQSRFGWTCQMDIEIHASLTKQEKSKHYEMQQNKLNIAQVRRTLLLRERRDSTEEKTKCEVEHSDDALLDAMNSEELKLLLEQLLSEKTRIQRTHQALSNDLIQVKKRLGIDNQLEAHLAMNKQGKEHHSLGLQNLQIEKFIYTKNENSKN
ncbi:hypothetical protein O181_036189 [Austropuccinia psidii MF-1]|uniref:Methyltransferase domain-containing protein n=1 Tax=Austropuccinia psidii MF-1 TaxID=1389203 RepID=A0A9Q3D431_9BASI|nr:hypothetical protein [Austropuccinia psidii MF-1]